MPCFVAFANEQTLTRKSLAGLLYATKGTSGADKLAVEELVLEFLREEFVDDGLRVGLPASTQRLIRRTKEFLQTQVSNPIRLHNVGHAVGASPAYLTDVFRRVEGTSLHRYITQMRLARALLELPHTDDLTNLALQIGFSSHSHFSATFHRAFGCTPSQFRQIARGRLRSRKLQ